MRVRREVMTMLVDVALGLHSLGAMARALSGSMPLEPLLETAAEGALHALSAASVSISRLDPDGRTVRALINVGDLAPTEVRWPRDETYPLAEWSPLERVLNGGATRTDCLATGNCHPQEAEILRSLGKGSSVTAAILVDGTVWGEFYATRHCDADPFIDTAVDYVDVLTSIVGAAISRSLREALLEQLAFHDALTGALNRRGFERGAAHVFGLPEGASRVVTTIALDINGLKQVNDQHGHARGDELIAAVARALQESFAPYPGSLVGRVGGDEFAVLVPHHEPDLVAQTVATLCREAGPDWSFGRAAGISAGLASTLLTGDADATHADLLAAADRALYLAKQQPQSAAVVSGEYGRNTRGRRAGDR